MSVDQYVTDPNTWNLYNNQVMYAELGAKWLFDQLGGKGTVWYTRGAAGASADSDRDKGFKEVLKQYPGIKVVPTDQGVFTGWDPAKTTQLANDFIQSGQYDKINGIWASGMGTQIVDAIKAANKKFVPIADADIGGFVKQLLDPTNYPGPRRCSRDQHGVRRRCRHHCRAQAPRQAAGAGRSECRPAQHHPAHPPDPGQHDPGGQGCPEGLGLGAGDGSAVAAQPVDPGLDHVRSEHGSRELQGQLTRTRASTQRGMPAPAGIPRVLQVDLPRGAMTIATTDLVLEATGISKTYGAVVALRSASLAVRPGEVHALMGANGAGKSTLVKILTGAVHPDAGRIAVRGRERTVHSPGRGAPRRPGVRLPGPGHHP